MAEKIKPRIRALITNGGLYFVNKIGDVYIKERNEFYFSGTLEGSEAERKMINFRWYFGSGLFSNFENYERQNKKL